VNFVFELAFRLLFAIVAEVLFNFVAHISYLLFLFLRRTGDFFIEVVTLDYFRDFSKVPELKKPFNPVPEWVAALLGVYCWSAFAAAAYFSWPWLSSL
jgi:hypothetical protein